MVPTEPGQISSRRATWPKDAFSISIILSYSAEAFGEVMAQIGVSAFTA
jgi:hypothetical protein